MKDVLPLFGEDDRDGKKPPAPVHAGKKASRWTGANKHVDDPALVLQPMTAELKGVTLRQRVLPRYIFEQLISEPVLDPTNAEPRGTVLGQVVVHNAHCQRTKEDHLHLIWWCPAELPGVDSPEPPICSLAV